MKLYKFFGMVIATLFFIESVASAQDISNNKLKLRNKLLEGRQCIGCKLNGTDLSKQNLKKVKLNNAELKSVNLAGANLENANLTSADLTGANLENANLTSADLTGANLEGVNLTGAKLIKTTLISVELTGAKLINAEFKKADLKNADLNNTNLSGAHLSGINISILDKDIKENKNICPPQTQEGKDKLNEEGASNLNGANLNEANLNGAYMAGDELAHATLVGAKLHLVILYCSDLTGGNLVRADLTGANLSLANLYDTNLTDVNLNTTNLRDANIQYNRYDFGGSFTSKLPRFLKTAIEEILINPEINTIFNTIKIGFAPFAILFAIKTFWTKTISEHRSYLDEKFKEFEGRAETINVRKMLDSELRLVELFPSSSFQNFYSIPVTDGMLMEALIKEDTDIKLKEAFENYKHKVVVNKESIPIKLDKLEEQVFTCVAIRENFNKFLDYLQQFNLMIESHVVNISDLKNYIEPWIQIIKRVSSSEKVYVLKYMGLLNSVKETELTLTQRNVRRLFENFCSLEDLLAPMRVESIAKFLAGSDSQKCNWALWFKTHHQYEKYKIPESNNTNDENSDGIINHQQLINDRGKEYEERGYEVFYNKDNYFELNIIASSSLLSLILIQVLLRIGKPLLRFLLLFVYNPVYQISFIAQPVIRYIIKINSKFLLKVAGQPDIIAISKKNEPISLY